MANEHTQQTLFRKKSMDRVSSPEQLNEYIRVANPSIWVVMAAIIILLVGICVWGVMGRLDTTLPVAAVAQEGVLTVYIQDAQIEQVHSGMTVLVDDREYTIESISLEPVQAEQQLSEYALYVGGLQAGQWVYAAQTDGELADGVYDARILVERIRPMSFVLN